MYEGHAPTTVGGLLEHVTGVNYAPLACHSVLLLVWYVFRLPRHYDRLTSKTHRRGGELTRHRIRRTEVM